MRAGGGRGSDTPGLPPPTSSSSWCLWPGHMQGWDNHLWCSRSFSEPPPRVCGLLERAGGMGWGPEPTWSQQDKAGAA